MTRKILLAAVSALTLSACATVPPAGVSVGAPVSPARVDINPGAGIGRLDASGPALPTLKQMQDLVSVGTVADTSGESRLRIPAIRDVAHRYGAQGGLAWASKQLNQVLEEQAPNLSKTWDFNRMLIVTHGQTVLPPVISTLSPTYDNSSDGGRILRVADRYYRILEPARFASRAPMWHGYLLTSYSVPVRPNDEVLPKTAAERALWATYVAEGWETGKKQAMDIYKLGLNTMEREFKGMAIYYQLYEQGMVSAPVVASVDLGITGTGTEARVGDRVLRITQDAKLNVRNPSNYKAAVSGLNDTDAATPPGDAAATPPGDGAGTGE